MTGLPSRTLFSFTKVLQRGASYEHTPSTLWLGRVPPGSGKARFRGWTSPTCLYASQGTLLRTLSRGCCWMTVAIRACKNRRRTDFAGTMTTSLRRSAQNRGNAATLSAKNAGGQGLMSAQCTRRHWKGIWKTQHVFSTKGRPQTDWEALREPWRADELSKSAVITLVLELLWSVLV